MRKTCFPPFHLLQTRGLRLRQNHKVHLHSSVLMITIQQIQEMTRSFQTAPLAHLVHSSDITGRRRIIAREDVELVIVAVFSFTLPVAEFFLTLPG